MIPQAAIRGGDCTGMDVDIFFPDRGGDVTTPKAICSTCPVREECGDWGLRHEHDGIWGGLSERERRIIRRKRGIVVDNGWLMDSVIRCGTRAGWAHHIVLCEVPCEACRRANGKALRRRKREAS